MQAKENTTQRLVVGKPNIMDKEGFLRDLDVILDTGIFTNLGPFATKLEAAVCSYLNVKHAFAVSNASVGLAMMLRALEFRAGGEVILPAYTFVATAHAVIECGLKPIFCECDSESHLIGSKEVAACFSTDTVAILAVNLWGLACDVEGLQSFADEKHIGLLYDSAHSFGARASCGRFLGNFGDAEVFSMHATKLFNSFEGGLITTNSDLIAERLAPMRNFGITGQDQVSCWGSNYKLSEVHAAFALRQLCNIEKLVEFYKDNSKLYTKLLDESCIPGIRNWNKSFLSHEGCTHSYICLEVQQDFPLTRDEVVARLRVDNVFAKRYFFPGLHKCQPYATTHQDLKLPVTEKLCAEVLVLPTGSTVTQSDIERVVNLLKKYSKSSPSDAQLSRNTVSEISVDYSHLVEKITYVRDLKHKYEELTKACEQDLLFLEASLGTVEDAA
mmetsp:Transcript_23394/g.57350  ORF Transcript_23394/g.57350 Transcript_23394/m.57350 type:complete len:444 (+) Transcript_23394:126-1457(+)